MTIAHISDLHFGRIAHPGVVEALVDEINAAEADLVAVSGDLTQRARVSEYEAARAMLEALTPPTLVVAGNHDVYPWWRPLRRLWTPLARYKQYITAELAPTFEAQGVSVLGLTSAYGPSIKGGRLGAADRAAVADYFSGRGDGFKVLVVHHQLHPTAIGSISPHPVARRARDVLDVAVDVGVDLILCGHLHVSAVQPVEVLPGTPRIVVASAGTATSNRYREPAGPVNVYNVVSIAPDAFSVEERRYVPDENRYVRDGETRFDRNL